MSTSQTSYKNLQTARERAKEKDGCDSLTAKQEIEAEFRQRFGHDAYGWQLDTTEALLLGLDCVVIAGTGSGKTMPFVMPLLNDKTKKTIIISPLNILQEDHCSRFAKMGIPAIAVNGENWTQDMKERLYSRRFQAILTSPEMCLKHPEFRAFLSESIIANEVAMIVIDEAHCITQWGGDFRKEYSNLNSLRAFFPAHVPFLVTSATLTPAALRDIQNILTFDIDKSFFINLGNDRPNVTMSVQNVKSSRDYDAVLPLLTYDGERPTKKRHLRRGVVFVNSVSATMELARRVKEWVPEYLHQYVDILHAQRTRRSKRRVMKMFRKRKIRVLIATEAAGMGCDIPDIEQVIQLGVPSSLSVWIQRAGRAGRSPNLQARAILLVEASVYQTVRKKKGEGTETEQNPPGIPNPTVLPSEIEGEGDEDEVEVEATLSTKGLTWRKKVERGLRVWIESKGCRRDVIDEEFLNPRERTPPTGTCCDNCDTAKISDEMDSASLPSHSRPQTPEQSPPSSAHSTPSRRTNKNGKRQMTSSEPSMSTRRGGHLKAAKDALVRWRFETKKLDYSSSCYTAAGIMPDRILNVLAANRSITTLAELESAASAPHVQHVDDEMKAERDERKRMKMMETIEHRNAKMVQKAQERREREEEQARRRAEKERLRFEEQQLKLREQELSGLDACPGCDVLRTPSGHGLLYTPAVESTCAPPSFTRQPGLVTDQTSKDEINKSKIKENGTITTSFNKGYA